MESAPPLLTSKDAEACRDDLFGDLSERMIRARLGSSVLGTTFDPVRIGKYVVHRHLGAGAMGVVYAGYHETLDRRVALKLVAHEGEADEHDRARLLREAKALARFDHPNVVRVYDAGFHEDALFIAMELVSGTTLAEWARQARPSWSETLAVYRQAGAGLAAAHRAEVIHRDFKPDNVMLGDDGRARVMDFGLARGLVEASPNADEDRLAETAQVEALATPVTRTGALIGTPAYLAPEQLAGQPADARSDQFSFCVSLWETMAGTRPFVGATVSELQAAMLAGPPTLRDASLMPGWVRRILVRGLDLDPDLRWPSMDALVDALGRDPSRRRRRIAVGGLVLAGAVAAAGSQYVDRAHRVERCEQDAATIDESWNPTRAEALREAFAAVDPQAAPDASARLESRLDAYADDWRTTREHVCLEATVEHTRSLQSHSASATCLEERRDALGAIVDGLGSPTPRDMRNAVLSAMGLLPIASCTDEAHLDQQMALPADFERRDRVRTLRRSVSRATGLQILGRYEEARMQAEQLRPAVAAVDHAPLSAELLIRTGSLAAILGDYEEAVVDLENAILVAGRVGHAVVEMDAFALLTWEVGHHLNRYDEGLRLGRLAQMTLAREHQEDSPRAAVLLAYIASIQEDKGDLRAARETYEEALAMARAHLGPEHPRVAAALNNLGGILDSQGDYPGALAYLGEALAIRQGLLGPDHPHVAESLHAMALVNVEVEQFDLAAERYHEALRIFEAAFGPKHPSVATVWFNLGGLEATRGNLEQSLDNYRRALRHRLEALGPDHHEVASTRAGIGHVLTLQRKLDDAVVELREAARINEAVFGRMHPDVAMSLGYLGTTYRRMGRLDEAQVALEEALAIQREVLGNGHINVAVTLGFLGEVHVARAQWQDAERYYRESLAIREQALAPGHTYVTEGKLLLATVLNEVGGATEVVEMLQPIHEAAPELPGMPTLLPAIRFELARAAWPEDPDRTRTLIELARTQLIALGPAGEKSLGEVDAWVESRTSP